MDVLLGRLTPYFIMLQLRNDGSDAGGAAAEGQSLLSKLNIFSEGSSGFLGKMEHKVQVLGPSGIPEPQASEHGAKGPVASSGLDHLARLGLVNTPQAQAGAVDKSPKATRNGPQQVRVGVGL